MIENFSEFQELFERTPDGYRYRFTFEGEDYVITQGKEDPTIFGIRKKNKWKVLTKGNLFNPSVYDMTLEEMVKHIQKGIKYFNVRNPVEIGDIRGSEWERYFKFELKERPGRLDKTYVILKLHCGKAQAKWHATK